MTKVGTHENNWIQNRQCKLKLQHFVLPYILCKVCLYLNIEPEDYVGSNLK